MIKRVIPQPGGHRRDATFDPGPKLDIRFPMLIRVVAVAIRT